MIQSAQAAGIGKAMTPAEVELAVGKPTSKLTKGAQEVWHYPDGGKVTFEAGRVVDIIRMPLAIADGLESPPPVTPAAESTTAPAAADDDWPVEPATLPAEHYEHLRSVEKGIEDLTAMHEQGFDTQTAMGVRPTGGFMYWIEIAVEAVLAILFTMVVLKLAFKWSDVDAEWRQMFIPAAATVVTEMAIRTGAELLWHTNQLFYVDIAISYFVLIATLRKATHAYSLARAVSVAGAAKLVNFVMWTMLSVVILQLLHG